MWDLRFHGFTNFKFVALYTLRYSISLFSDWHGAGQAKNPYTLGIHSMRHCGFYSTSRTATAIWLIWNYIQAVFGTGSWRTDELLEGDAPSAFYFGSVIMFGFLHDGVQPPTHHFGGHFRSSVISTVAPPRCRGPVWRIPLWGKCRQPLLHTPHSTTVRKPGKYTTRLL